MMRKSLRPSNNDKRDRVAHEVVRDLVEELLREM